MGMGIIGIYLDSIWEHVSWKEGRAGNRTLTTQHLQYWQEEEEPAKEAEGEASGRQKPRESIFLVTLWPLALH